MATAIEVHRTTLVRLLENGQISQPEGRTKGGLRFWTEEELEKAKVDRKKMTDPRKVDVVPPKQ